MPALNKLTLYTPLTTRCAMTQTYTRTPYNTSNTPVLYQIEQQELKEQVYLTRFDLRTAFSNADKYTAWYNNLHESVKDHIRGGTLATFYRVLEVFVRHNNYVQLLTIQPVPCRLNNCMLAYQLKVNRRTIINHLNKLEKAGYITKTFRGTYADYEILINPAVLLNNPALDNSNTKVAKTGSAPTQDNKENQTDPRPDFPHNAKNMRPISLFKNLEKSNIPQPLCELGENPSESEEIIEENPTQNAGTTCRGRFSCYTPKAGVAGVENHPLSTAKNREQNLGAAGGAKIEADKPAKKKFPAWQLAMVQDFYSYAIPLLYPYHEFDPQMKTKILNKLYGNVYGGFKEPNFTRKHWEEYQKNLLERVDMVAVWKDKPLEGEKYRFLVNPLTYFDCTCEYGFVKTEEWLIKKRKQMALIKAEILLEKAGKEMMKGSDRLRIYHKWEKRFKNMKLPAFMPIYYRTMARIQQQLAEVGGRKAVESTNNLQPLTTHDTKAQYPCTTCCAKTNSPLPTGDIF